jgi:hypothetical protein
VTTSKGRRKEAREDYGGGKKHHLRKMKASYDDGRFATSQSNAVGAFIFCIPGIDR